MMAHDSHPDELVSSWSNIMNLYTLILKLHHPTNFKICSMTADGSVIYAETLSYDDLVERIKQDKDNNAHINTKARSSMDWEDWDYEDVCNQTIKDSLGAVHDYFKNLMKDQHKVKRWKALLEENPNCPVLLTPLVLEDTYRLSKCNHLISKEAWYKISGTTRRCPLCRTEHEGTEVERFCD